MEKILNPEGIDALVRTAQEGARQSAASDQKGRQISPCNFRQAGRVNQQQARSVSMLHERFARNLSNSLGAYLRVAFEVNLVSVEPLAYTEFLQQLTEMTYMATLHLRPSEAVAIVQIDLSLAFPILDLLLGGRGKAESQLREVTEIEEQILESAMKIIGRELQTAWKPLLELECRFARRESQAQIARLMPPNEKTLCLTFQIRMSEVLGSLKVILPAAISNALLRKLAQQESYQRPRGPAEAGARIWGRLQDCRFPVELALSGVPVPIRDLLGLQPGQVLVLQHRIGKPALLSVSGKPMFTAQPARSENLRSGLIQQRLPVAGVSNNVSNREQQ